MASNSVPTIQAASPAGAAAPVNPFAPLAPLAGLSGGTAPNDSIAPLEAQQEGAAGAGGTPNLNAMTSPAATGSPGAASNGSVSPAQLLEEIQILEALLQQTEQRMEQTATGQEPASGSGAGGSPASGGGSPGAITGGGGGAPSGGGGAAPASAGGSGGAAPAAEDNASSPSSGSNSSSPAGASNGGTQASSPASANEDPGNVQLTPAEGNIPQNAQAMYKYFTSQGLSPNAAAGVIGNIYGESGGNPESVGSGGNGLIGWTPPLAGAVTGNAQKDLAFQLPQVMKYIKQNGSVADLNANASSPAAASKYFTYHYERPANPAGDSPKREASANAVAQKFGGSSAA